MALQTSVHEGCPHDAQSTSVGGGHASGSTQHWPGGLAEHWSGWKTSSPHDAFVFAHFAPLGPPHVAPEGQLPSTSFDTPFNARRQSFQ